MRDPTVLGVRERREVEAALDLAFAPLRERRTDLSPLRVRAAVRWGRAAPAPAALPWSGTIARLSELSVAVGVGVVIFTAALGPAVIDRAAGPAPDELAARATVGRAAALEQREMRALRLEWAGSLRESALLHIDRYISIQDWLDPTVVRPAATRLLDLPAPLSRSPSGRGLY